jgi:hypothetical protein
MPNLMTIHQLGVIREGRGGLNIYVYIYKIMYIKVFFLGSECKGAKNAT